MPNTSEATSSQPHDTKPTVNSPWTTDASLMAQLSNATLVLLDVLVHRFDDELVFSEALSGGGEVMCEMEGLDESFAPLVEAEVARLVAEAAGLPPAGLFSPAMPSYLTEIDALPVRLQADLVLKAGDYYAPSTEPVSAPDPRISAFYARSVARAPTRSTAHITASVPPKTASHAPAAQPHR